MMRDALKLVTGSCIVFFVMASCAGGGHTSTNMLSFPVTPSGVCNFTQLDKSDKFPEPSETLILTK